MRCKTSLFLTWKVGLLSEFAIFDSHSNDKFNRKSKNPNVIFVKTKNLVKDDVNVTASKRLKKLYISKNAFNCILV